MQGYEFQKMVLLVVVWLIQFYVILLSFIKVFLLLQLLPRVLSGYFLKSSCRRFTSHEPQCKLLAHILAIVAPHVKIPSQSSSFYSLGCLACHSPL